MSREKLEEFRTAVDKAIAEDANLRVDVGNDRTRYIWSRAGVEIITGDGVDVLLMPDVVARIAADALEFAFKRERTELVDEPGVKP